MGRLSLSLSVLKLSEITKKMDSHTEKCSYPFLFKSWFNIFRALKMLCEDGCCQVSLLRFFIVAFVSIALN